MDRFYLYVICASILLLVTAFALGTPGLQTDGPSETTSLLRVARDKEAPYAWRGKALTMSYRTIRHTPLAECREVERCGDES